jgi:hypothetical protein
MFKRDPTDQTKNGTAILIACLVQTINETDPSFQERFLKRLGHAHYDLKNNSEVEVQHEMELLAWTRSMLTGFDHISGQQEPLNSGYSPD